MRQYTKGILKVLEEIKPGFDREKASLIAELAYQKNWPAEFTIRIILEK